MYTALKNMRRSLVIVKIEDKDIDKLLEDFQGADIKYLII